MNRKNYLKSNLALVLGSLPLVNILAKSTGTRQLPVGELKTGGVKMIEIDGGYKVWTKKVGHGKIKMLTLHGGPGCTHEYLECFEDFLPQEGIEFYYYDQLGSEYSDKPTDTKLWNIERFTEEVEQVRKGLGLDNFYLYGQSWGGMLAIEYALKYGTHLKGLVISNMTASIPSYLKYVNELRAKFPTETIRMMEQYEAKEQWDAKEYQDILINELYNKHICRIVPWPEPVSRMFKHLATPVYNTMQGNNEFVVTGTFKDWDRWKDLSSIKNKTLVIGGRYDSMLEADLKKMSELIPNCRFNICEHGSHLSMWDDQENYFRYLLDFIKSVEAGKL
ncbi:MAG: proline iminopeptidase-family hydrolase [Chitinophagales bacterium]